MQHVRRKALACVVSLVMVFSMTSAAALTAFADQLAAGTIATQASMNKVVYDDVYGVMGTTSGDYALMMKTITYEAQYHSIPNYQYFAKAADVVKSDGTVVVHTNTALLEHQGIVKDKGLGARADYELGSLSLYKNDMEAGYVKVTKKDTNKQGLLKLDGTELIPCAYDSLAMTPEGDIVGVTIVNGTANVAIMNASGATSGSFSFPAAQPEKHQYVYTRSFGDLMELGASIDGKLYSTFVKKSGSQYVQVPDIKKVIYGETTWVVYVKSDGNMYYCEPGKPEVKFGPDEGFSSAWAMGNRITLNNWETDEQVHYSTDGTKIAINDDDVRLWLRDSYITEYVDEDAGEWCYVVCDFSGKELTRFETDYLSGIGSLDYYTVLKDCKYDETTGDLFEAELQVYDSKGAFVKSLGKVVDWDSLDAERRYDSTVGESVIIGYSLPATASPTGNIVYYDTNFNVIESLPPANEQVDGSSQMKLVDGTNVNVVRTSTRDNQTGELTAHVAVTDDAGNAIVRGGKTLAVSPQGNFWTWNSVKHGNADVWWATDASGKYGAIDSSGKTVVDFKYEAYFDAGNGNTDYALVLENGEWKFIKVANGNEGQTAPVIVEPTTRLQGENAFDTMTSIVDEGNFQTGGTVVLATFDGYWDALTAAGIAGLTDAPVLMTFTNELTAQTKAQLEKLQPKTIIVCGGTAVVTESVAEAAKKAAGNAEVVRAAGAAAPGTAVDVYNKAKEKNLGTWSDTAFVCTINGYWDALAAAPISYSQHMPIFLTDSESSISADTLSAMKKGGIKQVYIVGGEAVVKNSVKDAIEKAGITVKDRLWGDTAVQTSEAVAKFGLSLGLTANKVGVATVNGYWDALSGAALCGRQRSVVVLVLNATSSSISGFIKSNAAQIDDVYIFGGPAAVADDTEAAIMAAAD